MYKIAKYLTREERERACAATYHGCQGCCTPHPRTALWRDEAGTVHQPLCPLGVAFGAQPDTEPDARQVAAHLLALGRITEDQQDAVARAAGRFIDDWDRGVLDGLGLPRALGLTRRRRRGQGSSV